VIIAATVINEILKPRMGAENPKEQGHTPTVPVSLLRDSSARRHFTHALKSGPEEL
jgi:hypothetical protein